MSLGLFGALKAIPWSEVVGAAPTVVRGAQQLWKKVRDDPADAPAPPAAPPPAAPGDDPHAAALAALAARADALEARTAMHGREAVAASELIATLAEQNARLIEAVEGLRQRARTLLVAVGVLGVAVVALGVLAFTGR